MNKVQKNKTKLPVTLPVKKYFTIPEVVELNPSFKEITLRVRLTNAITDGKIVEVGSLPGGKGRPVKVFAFTPVTKEFLDALEKKDIQLVDRARERLVNVVNVVSVTGKPSNSIINSITTPTSMLH